MFDLLRKLDQLIFKRGTQEDDAPDLELVGQLQGGCGTVFRADVEQQGAVALGLQLAGSFIEGAQLIGVAQFVHHQRDQPGAARRKTASQQIGRVTHLGSHLQNLFPDVRRNRSAIGKGSRHRPFGYARALRNVFGRDLFASRLAHRLGCFRKGF